MGYLGIINKLNYVKELAEKSASSFYDSKGQSLTVINQLEVPT